MEEEKNINDVVPNDGVVTQRIIRLPGMESGTLGTAGEDKPGPSIRNVAINPVVYIGVEIIFSFLRAFLGLLAVDGLGLAELTPPADAMTHLYKIAGIALAPALLALLQELYEYLGKIRTARR